LHRHIKIRLAFSWKQQKTYFWCAKVYSEFSSGFKFWRISFAT